MQVGTVPGIGVEGQQSGWWGRLKSWLGRDGNQDSQGDLGQAGSDEGRQVALEANRLMWAEEVAQRRAGRGAAGAGKEDEEAEDLASFEEWLAAQPLSPDGLVIPRGG
jgi:hypothetical protein